MARGIELVWAGGSHNFRLDIEHLRALQQFCDAGPAHILSRLKAGTWLVDDVVSTIRLALECGGMVKDEARKLVRLHVDDDLSHKHVLLASLILAHTLYDGAEERELGE